MTFWQHLPGILPQYCSNILAICCSNIAVISFFVCKLDLRQYCQNVLRQYCCKAFLGAGCSSTAAMHIAAILLQSSSNNCAVAILLQHYSIQVHIVTILTLNVHKICHVHVYICLYTYNLKKKEFLNNNITILFFNEFNFVNIRKNTLIIEYIKYQN